MLKKERKKECKKFVKKKKGGTLVCVYKVESSVQVILGGSGGGKEGVPSQRRQIGGQQWHLGGVCSPRAKFVVAREAHAHGLAATRGGMWVTLWLEYFLWPTSSIF